MKPNPQNVMKAKQKQQQEELQRAHAAHQWNVEQYKEQYLGKLCLVGTEQGLMPLFVTDVKHLFPYIALQLSHPVFAPQGQYMDVQGLRIYHVYSEEEVKELMDKAKQQPPANTPAKES